MKDYVTSEPFQSSQDITPSDRAVLVLACDGVFDVMSDQEALDVVLAAGDATVRSSRYAHPSVLSCAGRNRVVAVILSVFVLPLQMLTVFV